MTLTEYREVMQATASFLYETHLPPQKPSPRDAPRPVKLPRFVFRGMYLVPIPPCITVTQVQEATAHHFDIPFVEMVSDRRDRLIVRPRQIAMYLSRQLTPRSLPDIGRRFGNRDHTTVIHAIRRIEALCREDPELAHDVEILRGRLAA